MPPGRYEHTPRLCHSRAGLSSPRAAPSGSEQGTGSRACHSRASGNPVLHCLLETTKFPKDTKENTKQRILFHHGVHGGHGDRRTEGGARRTADGLHVKSRPQARRLQSAIINPQSAMRGRLRPNASSLIYPPPPRAETSPTGWAAGPAMRVPYLLGKGGLFLVVHLCLRYFLTPGLPTDRIKESTR
jgi:hypothetical protein